MKLLITGGCGFLGSNLAAHALAQGDELYVFDNLGRFGSALNLDWLRTLGKFEFIHGDIRNANDVARIIARINPDAIFHLAGQVAMTTSIDDPRRDFETNALGSLNILDAVRIHSPDTAILYSSTNKVYGDLEQYNYIEEPTRYVCVDRPNGFDENSALNFHSPYGCSKGSADQYMQDYARMYGLKTAVFRHSSMYGGRQFATYDQGWVGWFCQQATQTKKNADHRFTISGNGKQVRDVLHAEDMIQLYYQGIAQINTIKGNAFNIGGGVNNSLSLLELFALLEQLIGRSLNYEKKPPRSSDQRVFIADLGKISSMINWRPKVTAAEGVRKMLDWVSNE
jgi:CDP-paratose 2-epimerase